MRPRSDTPFFVSNGSYVAGHVVADTGDATFAKAGRVVSMISGDLNNDGFSDSIICKEDVQYVFRDHINYILWESAEHPRKSFTFTIFERAPQVRRLNTPSDLYLNTGGGQFTRAAWHLSSTYGNGLNAPMNSVTLGDL